MEAAKHHGEYRRSTHLAFLFLLLALLFLLGFLCGLVFALIFIANL
jgi:hypothetical protein